MRRGILLLIAGVLAGYTLGYNDAYRGVRAIGYRVSSIVRDMSPDHIRERRQSNAEQFRQAVHDSADVP